MNLFSAASSILTGFLLLGGTVLYLSTCVSSTASTAGFDSQLFAAVKEKNYEEVKQLLELNPNIANARDTDRRTPLHLATINNCFEIANLLVMSYNADVNVKDNNDSTPLHFAIHNIEMTRMLLRKGARVNVIQEVASPTPLHTAILYQYTDTVKLLLEEYHADPCLSSDNDPTSVHFAVIFGLVEIVTLFLDKGISPNLADSSGDTLLHHAVLYAQVDCVALLLHRGANVNFQNNENETPLHFVAKVVSLCDPSQNYFIIDLLLKNGADPEAINREGYTPLYYALSLMKVDIAEWLVEKGAQLRSNDQNTPLRELAAYYCGMRRGRSGHYF